MKVEVAVFERSVLPEMPFSKQKFVSNNNSCSCFIFWVNVKAFEGQLKYNDGKKLTHTGPILTLALSKHDNHPEGMISEELL